MKTALNSTGARRPIPTDCSGTLPNMSCNVTITPPKSTADSLLTLDEADDDFEPMPSCKFLSRFRGKKFKIDA